MRTKTLPFLSISSSSHEPRAGIRLAVKTCFSRSFGLHQVRARGTDELGDDDALGAVDDERAALGHPREVAHEDRLLADLAGLVVDEGDGDRQRARVGEVLLAALADGRGGLVEVEVAELDGEVAGVVLDRRDVVDRLPQPTGLRIDQPVERPALDVDQVGDVEGLVQAREGATRAGSGNARQDSDSSGGRRSGQQGGGRASRESATVQDSTGQGSPRRGAFGAHGPRPQPRVCGAGAGDLGGFDYWPTAEG